MPGDVGVMNPRAPGMPWRDIRSAAALAEELGYRSLSISEAWGPDAFTTVAQIAAVTSRIRLGTSIVPVFARSPANMAMTALSLAAMSEGRFFLGLGTSGRLVIEGLHGEPFDRPLDRMREYIHVLRLASQGERLDYEGEIFQLRRFRLAIPPARPRLPIYVASLGPRSLRLTGELADGWLPIFLSPERIDVQLSAIRAGAESAGRNISEIAVAPQVAIHLTDRLAAARDLERPHIAYYVGGMGVFYYRHFRRIGFAEEAERVRTAYLAGDREGAARLVSDGMVDATTLIGSPSECRAQMERFYAAGVTEIRLDFAAPNGEALVERMRAMAPSA